MNTELQNKVWSILPKEFKEEVKKMYESTQLIGLQPFEDVERADRYAAAMCAIFGEDNLTSDTDEEEMLTCEKSKAIQLYSHLLDLVENELMSEHYSEWCDLEREYIALFGENVFADYFGSKCLSDAHEDNFTKSELKSSEPKFKVGDKVRLKDVYEINEVDEDMARVSLKGRAYMEDFDNLELYTEPIASTIVDDCQSQPVTDCHDFDRTVKDGFREHNRLHIAAMAMQGILSNADRMKVYERIATESPCEELAVVIARNALRYADTLMAEVEKKGSK